MAASDQLGHSVSEPGKAQGDRFAASPAFDQYQEKVEVKPIGYTGHINPSPYNQYNPSQSPQANLFPAYPQQSYAVPQPVYPSPYPPPVQYDPVIELNRASSPEYESPKERYYNERNQFVRKVFSLVGIQLTITLLFCALVTGISGLRSFVKTNIPLYVISIVGVIFVSCLVFCTRKYSKQYPYNYIALFSFTLFESYLVGFICSLYSPESVLTCCMMTLGITIALIVYAYKTESDFTTKRGIYIVLFVSLFFFAISMSFNYDRVLGSVIALAISIMYGWFIIYDIQVIAGGKYSELSMDDYVLGALMLYIDVCGLFIYLLSLVGNSN